MKYFLILKVIHSVRLLMEFMAKNPDANQELYDYCKVVREHLKTLKLYLSKES